MPIASARLGYRIYSGVGGQMDFVRAATMSRDGRPIIALPSTERLTPVCERNASGL